MTFVYSALPENTGWAPIDADGNLITVTNLNQDVTMRATITYTPEKSTPGIEDIVASLELYSPEERLYPVQNIALHAAKLDASPPNPATPGNNTVTARLQLTGAPTEALNYTPLGTVTIVISKPTTEIYTWGHQHSSDSSVAAQIYWVIQIIGSPNSSIPGSVLTSELLPAYAGSAMGDHTHLPVDKSAGITVGASKLDANGIEEAWYSWTVYDSSIWSDDGSRWSYTMPTTIPGTDIVLGNKGWVYFIDYTSTTIPEPSPGIYGHMNRATLDEYGDPAKNPTVQGWVGIEHQETHGNIVPFGSYDASTGLFSWDIKAIIPSLQPGSEADYFWYIMDYLEVFNGYNRTAYIENELGNTALTTVTATYFETYTDAGGQNATREVTINVPHIDQATGSEPFAWHDHWSATSGTIAYGKHIDLLCKCNCTATTCPFWTSHGCGSKYHSDPSQIFCQCWTATESVTFTFSYSTPFSYVSAYDGLNLVNRAELWRSAEKDTDGDQTVWEGILVDILDVSILIPEPSSGS